MKLLTSQSDLFHGLVAALEDAGFLYTLRFEDEVDSEGKIISQRLEQAFFLHSIEIEFAQRFAADHAIFIDGTFNTNKLNLVLITVLTINNCDLCVPIRHSFTRSESKISFYFIFRSMDELIFNSPRYSY
jgi:MULE transposase domain